jgi:two-component system NtrC family response regulator
MEDSKRILIVDDDEEILKLLEEALKFLGYEVDIARNGESALKIFCEKRFDLVITDDQMPGMRGVELIRNILLRYPHFPIIALTGHGKKEELLNAGAKAFLSKPLMLEELKKTIEEIMK